MLKLSDFDFDLPKGLIAQVPAERRGMSRLIVLNCCDKTVKHHQFSDLPQFLRKGDVVVLNDTKVLPARLLGKRKSGGKVEILLLKPVDEKSYQALIKPLDRLKDNEEIILGGGFSCRLLDAKNKIIGFNGISPQEIMRRVGDIPLPPYIRRKPSEEDKERYQTIFAQQEGAVAAPTAGLHFTTELLDELKLKGVCIITLTLHVNYATFSPVRCNNISEHKMHEEYFHVPKSTMEAVYQAKKEGRRIFGVGTTVCKALEDAFRCCEGLDLKDDIAKQSTLYIYPPFSFKAIDCLITNFHLPRTSLLMLVAAFAGRDFILRAYQEAVEKRYHFYSYGDAMLIQ